MSAAEQPSAEVTSLDALMGRVKDRAAEFAQLPLSERIRLLEELRKSYRAVAEDATRAASLAKGVDPNGPLGGEDWIADPLLVLRNLRLLVKSLKDIAGQGTPAIHPSSVETLPDGRLTLRVFPSDVYDRVLLARHEAWVHFQPEVRSLSDIRARQAQFYRQPHGGKLVAVLGAGNVNSIPPTDCLYKMFVEGKVCVLKMNPVNAYMGPFFERGFKPLIDRGYFAVVSGGAEVGQALVSHPLVDEIHMTGSDKTHDAIVWGPPGPEAEARKVRGTPLLTRTITAELGNISPVIVVPAAYSDAELTYQAKNIVGMATHNGSFDCNSAKLLVTSRDWTQREAFLKKVADELAKVPPRKAYYPGAEERWKKFTANRPQLQVLGKAGTGELPWALIRDVDATRTDDMLFRHEPWCAVLSEMPLPGKDAGSFLEAAVPFVNDKVWGTLCATIVLHPETEADAGQAAAVARAVGALKYGTVAINTWPAVAFGVAVTPWGAYPGATAQDIQSGRGFVHNTLMLEGVEKVVLRSPLKVTPVPPWFPNHRSLLTLGKRLVEMELSPSWLKVPGIAAAALDA